MSDHHHHQPDLAGLTRNQSLVMNQLACAVGPLSAYTILDQLRVHGLRAPLQVYRALDKLVEIGMVHRLESLNAFVACRQPGCETNETIAFAICDICGHVAEISDPKIARDLSAIAEAAQFVPRKTTVELRGACRLCQAA